MRKRIRGLLRDNRGLSNTIAMMYSMIILTAFAVMALSVIAAAHRYDMLESFADEIAEVVGEAGKCTGTDITEAYDQLADAYGFRPALTLDSGRYVDQYRKTVQYGEPITVQLKLNMGLFGMGEYKLPFQEPFAVTKITQSEQYWK